MLFYVDSICTMYTDAYRSILNIHVRHVKYHNPEAEVKQFRDLDWHSQRDTVLILLGGCISYVYMSLVVFRWDAKKKLNSMQMHAVIISQRYRKVW